MPLLRLAVEPLWGVSSALPAADQLQSLSALSVTFLRRGSLAGMGRELAIDQFGRAPWGVVDHLALSLRKLAGSTFPFWEAA